jgi:integrase
VASKITKAVKQALKESEDGYLISGLSFNKYGDRSNAVGKRFERIKKVLGFSSKQVFHSIRKCVVTQLEQGGVPESVVADLVGHEKQTMTYGLYSGGSSLTSIREAVEKLKYPL